MQRQTKAMPYCKENFGISKALHFRLETLLITVVPPNSRLIGST